MKKRIDSIHMHDVNKTMRVIGGYAWIGTGVLFMCYIYFVGSITFSIIKQKELEQENKHLVSYMSTQEFVFLNSQKDLNLSQAPELGLVPAESISYAHPSAVAFHAGR